MTRDFHFDKDLDLARDFATAEAAFLVGAALSSGDSFQMSAAWTANVLALMRSGRGMMMPAVLDLVDRLSMDGSGNGVGAERADILDVAGDGKMNFPSGFLSPLLPSELW